MGCGPSRSEIEAQEAREKKALKDQEELAEKVTILNATPFFMALAPAELEKFAAAFKVRVCEKETFIINQGEIGTEFYIIWKGLIEVYTAVDDVVAPDDIKIDGVVNKPADVQKQLTFVCSKQPGDFFGETALLSENSPRTATIKTVGSVKLLSITASAFDSFLSNIPSRRADLTRILELRMDKNIKNLAFFGKVPPNKLGLIGSMFRYVPLPSGQLLFEAGSIGQMMFVVQFGAVKAFIRDKNSNQEVIFKELGPGSYFGEISMLVDMPRTASIAALENCLLLALGKKDCKTMLQLIPELRADFTQLMKERTAAQFRQYKIPFFTAIPTNQYAELAEMASIDQIAENTTIFKEGDPGKAFHIIAFGEVSVTVSKNNQVIELCKLGVGKYFGEMALLQEGPRTSSVIATSRSVIMTISKEKFAGFFKRFPEALSDFKVKLERYDIKLDSLIHHEIGRVYFQRHLRQEFSEENILFFFEARAFRQIDDEKKREETARFLFENYLQDSAPKQINVIASNFLHVDSHIKKNQFPTDLFNSCANEVLALMSSDSFERFKQGDLFREFLQKTE